MNTLDLKLRLLLELNNIFNSPLPSPQSQRMTRLLISTQCQQWHQCQHQPVSTARSEAPFQRHWLWVAGHNTFAENTTAVMCALIT